MSVTENVRPESGGEKAKPTPAGGTGFEGNVVDNIQAINAALPDHVVFTDSIKFASFTRQQEEPTHKSVVADAADALNAVKDPQELATPGTEACEKLRDCLKFVLDEEGPNAVDKLAPEISKLLTNKKLSITKLPENTTKQMNKIQKEEGNLESDYNCMVELTDGKGNSLGRDILNLVSPMELITQGITKFEGFNPKILGEMSAEMSRRIEHSGKDGHVKAVNDFAKEVSGKLEKLPSKLKFEIIKDPLEGKLEAAAKANGQKPPEIVRKIRLFKEGGEKTKENPKGEIELDEGYFVYPVPGRPARRAWQA